MLDTVNTEPDEEGVPSPASTNPKTKLEAKESGTEAEESGPEPGKDH